jgi:hypothetical protein
MANFLGKFIAGAAGAGAALYADKYREDRRAELLAQRDKVLSEQRMAELKYAADRADVLEVSSRAFEVQMEELKGGKEDARRIADNDAALKRVETQIEGEKAVKMMDIEADEKSPERELNNIKLKEAQERRDLIETIFSTKDPKELEQAKERYSLLYDDKDKTAKRDDVEYLVANGIEKETAIQTIYGGGKDAVIDIFKTLAEERAATRLRPGEPGYEDNPTLLKKAREMAAELTSIVKKKEEVVETDRSKWDLTTIPGIRAAQKLGLSARDARDALMKIKPK